MSKAEKILLVNSTLSETRIALIDNSKLKAVNVEQNWQLSLVGNIYKGKISRVLPGIQSAFVDIGLDRSAFLYVEDVLLKEGQSLGAIETHVEEGQEIIVQVAKDPLGTKGARVTMNLTLAGRYVVFLPDRNAVNISKKIVDQAEHERLHKVALENVPAGHGLIVRTAAENIESELFVSDVVELAKTWEVIAKKIKKAKSPSLIHKEPSIAVKTLRDIYTPTIDRIVVDNLEVHEELLGFLQRSIPEGEDKLEYHDKLEPLFDFFEVESQFAKVLKRKIWLPSGGYLIIESTEALTTFDVNTGRYVSEGESRTTILTTNTEAAAEIANQLELRNIGGIIVIDFIDMDAAEDRQKVYEYFCERVKGDRAKTNVLNISELGLVQMTRKRSSDSLTRILSTSCPHCRGSGRISNTTTEMNHVLREVMRLNLKSGAKRFRIRVRPEIFEQMTGSSKLQVQEIEKRYNVTMEFVRPSGDTHTDQSHIEVI